MPQTNKPLAEMSESEVRALLEPAGQYVNYSYNDVVSELDRRHLRRQSKRSFILSLVAVTVAALSLLASVLVAVFKK